MWRYFWRGLVIIRAGDGDLVATESKFKMPPNTKRSIVWTGRDVTEMKYICMVSYSISRDSRLNGQ